MNEHFSILQNNPQFDIFIFYLVELLVPFVGVGLAHHYIPLCQRLDQVMSRL